MYKIMFAFTMIGAAFWGGQALADHGELSAGDIKNTVVDAKLEGRDSQNRLVEIVVQEDGSLELDVPEKNLSDTGKWTLEGSQFCSEWKKVRRGKKNCSIVRHLNGNKYLFKSEDRQNSYNITK